MLKIFENSELIIAWFFFLLKFDQSKVEDFILKNIKRESIFKKTYQSN